MDQIRNGMPARELGTQGWHRPWSDDAGGACVEAKELGDGRIALRQSSDPHSPALIYHREDMESFILAAKSGAADFLLRP